MSVDDPAAVPYRKAVVAGALGARLLRFAGATEIRTAKRRSPLSSPPIKRQSRERDHRFESPFLQRGVYCEPVRAGGRRLTAIFSLTRNIGGSVGISMRDGSPVIPSLLAVAFFLPKPLWFCAGRGSLSKTHKQRL